MTKTLNSAEIESLRRLQQITGYTFKNHMLAIDCVSIPVSKADRNTNFERLEYLGDRIYNMCVATSMVAERLDKPPSSVHPSGPQRMSNARQVDIANSLGLNGILLMQRHRLPSKLVTGRTKLLADVLEAVVAAIFIDSGCDFKTIYKIYLTKMEMVPYRDAEVQVPSTQLQFAFETAAP